MELLLSAVGQTILLDSEELLDAVTAVSGSGPAYVFHMIEALAAAGQASGLSAELSLLLAKVTISGAGALVDSSEDDPTTLRINVTSPGGTTEAALEVLLKQENSFEMILEKAVNAAILRAKKLNIK